MTDDYDEYYVIYNSNIAGKQVLPIGYKEYKAPLTAGTYKLHVKATTYNPEYYFAEVLNENGDLTYYTGFYIDNGRDDDLVDKIPVGYTYEGARGGYPYGSFYKDGIEYAIGMEPAGTEPALANIEFDLRFTVAPATVDVKVDTVDGPITKYTGSTVNVSWYTTNTSDCSCRCQNLSGTEINCGTYTDPNCGSGYGYPWQSQRNPFTLIQPTTFKVTCN
jgi:hypothetical protein